MARAKREEVVQRIEEATSVPWLTMRSVLLLASGSFMLANLYLIFIWAPTAGLSSGFHAQRILYIHVPMAWVGFLAFFFVLIGSISYLWKRNTKWDALAYSAAEIGILFTTLVLITGMIWGKPVWGRPWMWEPKLTTTLILWLIYVGYIMVRAYAPSPAHGARYSAVLGIVGFIDVPIVYFAVQLWGGAHFGRVVGPGSESGSLEGAMRMTLMFALLTFTVFFAFLLRERYYLRCAEDNIKIAGYDLATQDTK